MTAPTALEATGICKSFRAVRALDDVTLSLRYGEVTALLGDNGAGKSTLVKCIAGVYRPDAGSVFVNGRNRKRGGGRRAGSDRRRGPEPWASRPCTRRWR